MKAISLIRVMDSEWKELSSTIGKKKMLHLKYLILLKSIKIYTFFYNSYNKIDYLTTILC